MGHERVGILPRRKPWSEITENIGLSLSSNEISVYDISKQTLENVRIQFDRLHKDKGVEAAFSFLVVLTTTNESIKTDSILDIRIDLVDNPSPLKLTSKLKEYVEEKADSYEYAELSERAAADAIIYWSKIRSEQHYLFQDTTRASEIWNHITGRDFCDIARVFFSKLTERYLRYFIERSLSAQTTTLKAREEFSKTLSSNIEDISRHAFETSKITQSFAAGWFNKYAVESKPTGNDIRRFISIAAGKLKEEILREQNSNE